jgi:hypothetical protein
MAVELGSKSELLMFLDKAISGLDSGAAFNIVRFLRKLATGGYFPAGDYRGGEKGRGGKKRRPSRRLISGQRSVVVSTAATPRDTLVIWLFCR